MVSIISTYSGVTATPLGTERTFGIQELYRVDLPYKFGYAISYALCIFMPVYNVIVTDGYVY